MFDFSGLQKFSLAGILDVGALGLAQIVTNCALVATMIKVATVAYQLFGQGFFSSGQSSIYLVACIGLALLGLALNCRMGSMVQEKIPSIYKQVMALSQQTHVHSQASNSGENRNNIAVNVSLPPGQATSPYLMVAPQNLGGMPYMPSLQSMPQRALQVAYLVEETQVAQSL